jgi:HEPN domain-containing protein
MKRARAEAERWLAQAESDLAFAWLGLREGFYAQTCFICQQATEKSLKALHYFQGERFVPGHSLVELLDGLTGVHPSLADLREGAQQLDQYYIATRYPNGLPGGTPAEVFTKRQAEQAVEHASRFVERTRAFVGEC